MPHVPPAVDDDMALLLRFANTRNDRFGRSERFGDAAGLSAWLSENGFAEAAANVTRADAAAVRELRDAVITLLLSHSSAPHISAQDVEDAENLLRRMAARYPLVTIVDRTGARLIPASGGLPGAIGRIFAAITELALADAWHRIKACRNQGCHFAFHDHSRNSSGAFCSNVCSSQVAMRNYRQRRRAVAQTGNDSHCS
ncbi:hypothetical protein LMG29542_01081 [Paraburkholderia humisilvae]|uniref:Zinc finger CGNR domain-containing protein n=3 Tax=Paraburkholderia humisilvae TaxID=627669 RepID=A0A6J5D8K2_9BURK|nr:hypothetical protein LMG29542_01081 [Paraburkholderia humisilvae]